MALLDRVAGTEEPKIPVHQFQAALDEWALGSTQLGATNAARRTAVINAFAIQPAEESDLDFLQQKFTDAVTNGKDVTFRKVLDNVLMISEVPDLAAALNYDTQANIVARLNEASGP